MLRKQQAGVAPETLLDANSCTQANTKRVYAAVSDATANMLAKGQSVVVDAVFANEAERKAISQIAKSDASRFKGIWLVADDHLRSFRVIRRTADTSDVDVNVVQVQTKVDPGPLGNWVTLSENEATEQVMMAASAIIQRN